MKTSILGAALLIVASLTLGETAFTESPQLGHISFIQGEQNTVEIYTQGQAGRRMARLNDPVSAETYISTIGGTSVEIAWESYEVKSVINGNTTVNIGELYQKFLEESLSPTERLWQSLKKLVHNKDQQTDNSTSDVAAIRQSETKAAESLYWKARTPNFKEARKLYEGKKYEESVVELKRVIDDNPLADDAANSLLILAMAQQQLKQKDAAIASLNRYMTDFPQHELMPVAKKVLTELTAQ